MSREVQCQRRISRPDTWGPWGPSDWSAGAQEKPTNWKQKCWGHGKKMSSNIKVPNVRPEYPVVMGSWGESQQETIATQ